jgi:hypothetical protein
MKAKTDCSSGSEKQTGATWRAGADVYSDMTGLKENYFFQKRINKKFNDIGVLHCSFLHSSVCIYRL